MYDPCFERLAGWATGPRFEQDIAEARRTFFDGTGLVYDDDRLFELRMSGLSEYYLFDRALPWDARRRTPSSLFLDEQLERLSSEEHELCQGFTRTVHGLFEVRRISNELVVLRDLFIMDDHRVLERRQLPGLMKGDIIEARLIPWGQEMLFGRAFTFHPREARRIISRIAKRIRKTGEADDPDERRGIIWSFARAALVHARQQQNNHAPPRVDLIYQNL